MSPRPLTLGRVKPVLLLASALAALTLLAAVISEPGQIEAAGYTVNTTADGVDANLNDTICATAQSKCSLRAAIQNANKNPNSVDVITIPDIGNDGAADVLRITIGCVQLACFVNDPGHTDLDIQGDVVIDGQGPAKTLIDAGDDFRVFEIFDDNSVVISDLTMRNGRSGTGAGIFVGAASPLNLSNVTLSGNNATGEGGGIYSRSPVEIELATFANNESGFGDGVGGGGGLYAESSATILRSTFTGNQANGSGGGAYFEFGANVENSTFSGNSATAFGGGIFAIGAGITNVRYSTVANNTGVGVFKSGAGAPGGTYFLFVTVSVNNSGDCSGNGSAVLSLDSDGTCGSAVTAAQPKLGPLAANGGPTKTHRLLVGSPALDGGGICGDQTPLDQRGVGRPQHGNCDIGAFEARFCLDRPETKVGTAAPNILNGTSKADTILGLAGGDTINGLGANDRLCGNEGSDTLNGGDGVDNLDGGPQLGDVCNGGPGNDVFAASCETKNGLP